MPCVDCLEGRDCSLHRTTTWEEANAKLMRMRAELNRDVRLFREIEKVLGVLEDRQILRELGIEP